MNKFMLNFRRGVKTGVQWLLFPTAIFGAAAFVYHAPTLGLELLPAQMIVFVSIIVLLALAERRMPANADWLKTRGRDTRVDATSLLVALGVADPLSKFIGAMIFSVLVVSLERPTGFLLFSGDLPFAVQLAAALLIAELGQYAMHRAAHQWLPLWRIHAAHHSADRIYWLNAFRVHPLNLVWHYLAGGFVLLLLGADDHLLIAFATVAAVASVFQHANLDLRYGFLNYIFSTNELHRWHHSNRREEGNSNYGTVLIVWDIVFGTCHRRADEQPAQLGLFKPEGYPVESYLEQLWLPFSGRWLTPASKNKCCTKVACC